MEFHPRYEDDISRFNRFEDHASELNNDTTNGDSIDSADRSTAASNVSNTNKRVDDIEREVGIVKTKMENMDSKLDLLIAATAPTPRSSTPQRSQPARERTGPSEARLPPPRQLRREQDRDGYVERLLQEERMRPTNTAGKANIASDIFHESTIPKPYIYVTREACDSLKQKLDIRNTLAPMEYVHAALALINDNRSHHPQDREHILRHIQEVAHDAIDRQWDEVRRWTQFIWDEVEKDHLRWSDRQLIHNHRVSMAISGSKGRGQYTTTNSNHTEGRAQRTEVICRAFNSRSGCRHRSHHDEGHIRHQHICSFCDSINRHCTGHNVLGCNNKTQYPGQQRFPQQSQHQPQVQQPYRPQDNMQWRPHHPPPMYSQQYPQHSKNAQ